MSPFDGARGKRQPPMNYDAEQALIERGEIANELTLWAQLPHPSGQAQPAPVSVGNHVTPGHA